MAAKFINLPYAGPDGRRRGFPGEPGRSRPYGYYLFNLEARTMAVQVHSIQEADLWAYELDDRIGIALMYPNMKDKSTWQVSVVDILLKFEPYRLLL